MRLFAGLVVASFVSACATSLSPTTAASAEPIACSDLAWDECGRAPACRHGRAFDREAAPGGGEIVTEHFECVPRYTTELVTDATMDIRALVGKPPAAIASLD